MRNFNRNGRRNSDSEYPSPTNRSRSRDKEIENEKKIILNKSYYRNDNQIEGKLYLSNIPIYISQPQITKEFEKYGRILDFSFRKKTDVPNPYYYGYITLSSKEEAENAMENINKNFNWTINPFSLGIHEKNNREKYLNKNVNLNSFLNKKINNQEDILSSNYKNINLNKKLNINLNNNIKIREIWVTNLPLSTDEASLYKEFFIYGEISKIELKTFWDKKNAFIKYRLAYSAKKALEKENNKYFNGNIIIISYSNDNQRKDIKGDEQGYKLTENNCKLIVICLNKNKETTNENNVLNIFKNYGNIKNVAIKNISNRNHIFIEYYKPEDGRKAIMEMNNEYNIENRKLLGDENCIIDFYFKNKFNEINPILNEGNNNMNMNMNINTNMNMNMNNQNNNNNLIGNKNINPAFIYQLLQNNLFKNQINFNKSNNNLYNQNPINQNPYNNIHNNENYIYNNNKTNNNQINNLNLTNQLFNLINKNNLLQQSKNFFPFMCQPSLFPNIQGCNYPQNAQNFQNFQNPNQNNLFSLFLKNPSFSNLVNNNYKNQINLTTNINNTTVNNNINKNSNTKNTKNTNNNKSNDVKDLLNKIISDKNNKKVNNNSDSDISSVNSNHSSEEMDFEKEYSLEEENLKYIWNGYLTKNKKDRVNVDIFKIRGKIDDNYFKGYILNICNRIQYEEVLKKHLLGIVAISPQNITQKEVFDHYLNYFSERQRCGVINIIENKYTLYITAPSEFSRKFYINPKKHLVGLLVDCTVEPNLYVDMNNLTLPPPVISLTEKRRIMNNNKKNENKKENNYNKNNNKNNNELIMKLKEQLKKIDNNNDNNDNIN